MNSELMEQARVDYINHVTTLIKTKPFFRKFLIYVHGEKRGFELITAVNKLNAEVKK
jgi:hypothetical protein